jgi:hypothetical protein
MKDDELNKQIKGAPFDFSGTKTDLNTILMKIKSGELTLSKQDLAEKINDAFEGVVKDVLEILEKYTESASIMKSIKIRLDRDFGDNSESKKRFYFKYNSSRDALMKFSIKFIRSVMDSEGADNYKKFVNRNKLIEFMTLLVKYDSKFKDGSEKGIAKYFENFSLTDIVSKIQSYTTLDNFLSKERSVIQTSAGLQFSDDSFNSNTDQNSDELVTKVKNIVQQVNRGDAEKLSEMIKADGGNRNFVKKNKLQNNSQSIKTFLNQFFPLIHNDADRLGRRLNALRNIKF